MLQSVFSVLKVSLVVVSATLLLACNGGSSDVVRLADETVSSEKPDLKLNVNVVKGPVAGAKVNFYAVDLREGDFGELSRATDYLLDSLSKLGVEYVDGELQFGTLSDAEVYDALSRLAREDALVGRIHDLQDDVNASNSIADALQELDNFIASETNTFHREAVSEIKDSFVNLADIKTRVANIPTVVGELVQILEDDDNKITFARIEAIAQSFSSQESDVVKNAGWSSFYNELDALQVASLSKGQVASRIDALFDEAEEKGWFVSDLVARRQLAALEDNVDNASDIFEVQSLVADAYIYEGNEDLKRELRVLRDDVITPLDGVELLKRREALVKWPLESLLSSHSTTQSLFAQFAYEGRQRFPGALQKAFVSEELDAASGRPVNWITEQTSDEMANIPSVDLGQREGLIYIESDLKSGIDLTSGARPLFQKLSALISIESLRGAGDNNLEDESVRIYSNGELLRFSNGDIVQSASDDRLSPELKLAAEGGQVVRPTRSVSLMSDVSLQSSIQRLLLDDRWLSYFAQDSEVYITHQALVEMVYGAVEEAAESLALSFSSQFQSLADQPLKSTLIFTAESLLEPELQPTIVINRYLNEAIGATIKKLSDKFSAPIESVLSSFYLDVADNELDGKYGSEAVFSDDLSMQVASLVQTPSNESYLVGTEVRLDNIVTQMRREFSAVLPNESLDDIRVDAGDFSFGIPFGGVDSDGDGVFDNTDAFPYDSSRSQSEVPADYAGLTSINVSAIEDIYLPFSGRVSVSLPVEQTFGQCLANPCIGVGDLSTDISSNWVVTQAPLNSTFSIDAVSDSSGFEFAGDMSGEYRLMGLFTTSVQPERQFQVNLSLYVPDVLSYQFDVNPKPIVIGDSSEVTIQTTTELCSAYSICSGVSVGQHVPISLLSGDLYASWSEKSGDGLAILESGADASLVVEYGREFELYVKSVALNTGKLVTSFVAGLDADSDGDGILDRDDAVPGDAACSSLDESIKFGDVLKQRESLVAVDESLLTPSSRVCLSSFKSERSLSVPIIIDAELGIEVYLDEALSLLVIESNESIRSDLVLLPAQRNNASSFSDYQLAEVIPDPDGNRLFVIYSNGQIDEYDFVTQQFTRLAEIREGYDFDSNAHLADGFLFVPYKSNVSGIDDDVLIFDSEGKIALLNFGSSNLLSSAQKVDLYLGDTQISFSDKFRASWSLKRKQLKEVSGVSYEVVEELPSIKTENRGLTLSTGQLRLKDYLTVELQNSSGTPLVEFSQPVLGVNGFNFDEDIFAAGDAVSFEFPERLVLLSEALEVIWSINEASDEFFKEFARSKSAPYSFPSSVTGTGDVVRAEIRFILDDQIDDTNDVIHTLQELEALFVGPPTNLRPEFSSVTVTDRVVEASLDYTAIPGGSYLRSLFSPQWLVDGELVLDAEANIYSLADISIELAYGQSLSARYVFMNNGSEGVTQPSLAAATNVDLMTSSIVIDQSSSSVGGTLTVNSVLATSVFENFKTVWEKNGLRGSNYTLSTFETSDSLIGDTIQFYLHDLDPNEPDFVGTNRLAAEQPLVLGYSFDKSVGEDFDGDGIVNSEDYFIYDPACSDQSQGIPDDFDRDGLPNISELDVSNNSIKSYMRIPDSDGDGLLDAEESLLKGSTYPAISLFDSDSDQDGNSDYYEVRLRGSDPTNPADFVDFNTSSDLDKDGILDVDEYALSTNVNDSDTDGDGLEDGYEQNVLGTEPTDFLVGSDLYDGMDSDRDGLSDGVEVLVTKTDPLDSDSDADGLTDGFEVKNNYDPLSPDTNKDGIPDGSELTNQEVALIGLGDVGSYRYTENASPVPSGTCYASWLYNNRPSIIAHSVNTQEVGSTSKIALASPDLSEVYLMDGATGEYLDLIPNTLLHDTVTSAAFADGANSFETLYLGFDNGLIREYDLSVSPPQFVNAFKLPSSERVNGIVDQGAFLIVETQQDEDSYTQNFFNKATYAFEASISGTVSLVGGIWDDPSSKSKLWVLSDSESSIFSAYEYAVPSSLSSQIDPENLNVDGLPLTGPIFVDDSLSQKRIRFGSGFSYLPLTGQFESSTADVDARFSFAVQTDDAAKHTVLVNDKQQLNITLVPDENNASEYWSYTRDAFAVGAIGLAKVQEDVALLSLEADSTSPSKGYLKYTRTQVGDSDADNVPGWYEEYAGFNDSDVSDAAMMLGAQSLLDSYNNYRDISSYIIDSDSDGLSDGEEADLFASSLSNFNVDTDKDGLTDKQEIQFGVIDPGACPLDPENYNSDGDPNNIADGKEDCDGDGLSNVEELNFYGTDMFDDDSDGDGVSDVFELFVLATDPNKDISNDFNLDGVLDNLDNDGGADFDGDGLTNAQEEFHGTNPFEVDTDGDGISDTDEINGAVTNVVGDYLSSPLLADTDADGLSDLIENSVAFLDAQNSADGISSIIDSDGDGLYDWEEALYGTNKDDPHSDADGLTDFEEVRPAFVAGEPHYTTDPTRVDTDDDSLTDFEERQGRDPGVDVVCIAEGAAVPLGVIKTRGDQSDSDGDGLSDRLEFNLTGASRVFYSNPMKLDSDHDGVSDFDEYEYEYAYDEDRLIQFGFDVSSPPNVRLSALNCDTDGDGLGDLEEYSSNSNAGYADTDNDLLNDTQESSLNLRADSPDTDGDGLRDGFEFYLTLTDPLSIDTDEDNIVDGDEDLDSDGVRNIDELERLFTDPRESDSGGLVNKSGYLQSSFVTSDGVKTRTWLYDLEKINLNGSVDTNGDLLDEDGLVVFINDFEFISTGDEVNDAQEDADGDGLSNEVELQLGTNPWLKDTDEDGLTDGDEVSGVACLDLDNVTPLVCTSDPTNSDTDRDQLSDGDEALAGTFPRVTDTDGDGLEDGEEVLRALDPRRQDTDSDFLIDSADPFPLLVDGDADGIYDFAELLIGSDPVIADTDGDTIPDGDEVWVFGYDSNGDLIRFGEDANNDGNGDIFFNSRVNDAGWVPSPRVDFNAPPYRTVQADDFFVSIPGLAQLYIWRVSDPLLEDGDADGLTDTEEVLVIENHVFGGVLNLGAPVDLTSDASFNSLKSESRFVFSNPLTSDTDGDAIADGDEDYDNDYASNLQESQSTDSSSVTPDSDLNVGVAGSDGLLDGIEINILGTKPNDQDSDSDLIKDGSELATFFVDALTANANTNPRLVTSLGDCLAGEVGLESAGKAFCFDVQYVSYPTLVDSDYDTVDDNNDDYPLDPACSIASQGFDRPDRKRCYSSWMSEQLDGAEIASIDSVNFNQIAFYHANWDSVIRYDLNAKQYLKELDVNVDSADFVAYDYASDSMFLLSAEGALRFVDLTSPSTVNVLPSVNLNPDVFAEGLLAINNHLLVQRGEGALASIAMYDLAGLFIDEITIADVQLAYAVWDDVAKRLYVPTGEDSIENVGYLSIETASPGSNGFTSALQVASVPFDPIALSYLVLDNSLNTLIAPSGYQFSANLDVATSLSGSNLLGRSFRSTALQMLLKDSTVTGRTDETYLVSTFLSNDSSPQDSVSYDRDSVQVFVDSRAVAPVVANGFDFVANSENEVVWGIVSQGDEVVQVTRRDSGVDIRAVGLADVDSDGIPCFYERRFDLVDNAGCGALSSLSGITKFEDADGDKLVNVEEYDQLTNPRLEDTDGDGWSDYDEVLEGTDPLDPSSF